MKCPMCGSKLGSGIVEEKCLGIGPGEGCDVCPHYYCCDALVDETGGKGCGHEEKVAEACVGAPARMHARPHAYRGRKK